MILASVDLPAPFSPTRPCVRPATTEKSTPRSARTAPKLRVSPRQCSKGGPASGAARSSRRLGSVTNVSGRLLASDLRIVGELRRIVFGQQLGAEALEFLDLTAFEFGDHGVHPVITHFERVLDHQGVDL